MWSLASHFTPLYFSTMVLWERKGTENIVMQTQKGPLGGRREYIYLSIYDIILTYTDILRFMLHLVLLVWLLIEK